jgi:hypothetical protein
LLSTTSQLSSISLSKLGLELEGQAPVKGRWAERVVGLDGLRVDVAMMRTPDGHSRLELMKFHSPTAVSAEPKHAPANTLGIRRLMFAVKDIEDVLARLHAHGAEFVGELASTRTAIGSATSAPRGHHRRAGRAAQLKRSTHFCSRSRRLAASGEHSTDWRATMNIHS